MKIDIMIANKDRPTELTLLLQSLRTQTYQDFDIYILDDTSGTPLNNYHFLNVVIQQMKLEGHRVKMLRNNIPQGVSKTRQLLVDIVMKEGKGELCARFDDDVILEADCISKMVDGINEGYDLMSCLTPPIGNPAIKRETKFVKPIINRVVLDNDGNFIINGDDCGHDYLEEEVIPTDHFRSSALYKKEIHNKVNYDLTFTKCGFREEEIFSFRCILKGFKLGVHTGAKVLHLLTPSGGDRRGDYQNLAIQNQRILNRWVKQMVKEKGNFIEKYHKDLGIEETEEDKFKSMDKPTNLIYSREE